MIDLIIHLIMISAGAALYIWAQRKGRQEIINEFSGHKYTTDELLKAMSNLSVQAFEAGVSIEDLSSLLADLENKKSPTTAATDGEGNTRINTHV